MIVEQHKQRRLLTGCGLAAAASVGLMAFSIAYHLAVVSDALLVPLVAGLAIVMGVGTTVAIFSLKRS